MIGLLVAVVIVIVVAAVLMGNGKNGPVPTTAGKDKSLLDSKSTKNTVVGRAIDTGKATDCQERLRQITLGIQAWKASEATEQNPRTLKDIGLGKGSDYFQCPMSNKPYTYDPGTGIVKCPTHSQF